MYIFLAELFKGVVSQTVKNRLVEFLSHPERSLIDA